MIARMVAIAGLTLREAVRNKVFVNLGVFAGLMVAMTLMLTGLTIGQQQRIIHTVSFATLSLVGNMIAIFLGAGLIAKEIERKTLYTIVSRPLARFELVLGRYLGMAVVLAMNTFLGGVLVLGVLGYAGWPAFANFALSLGLIFAEMLVVLAIAVLFSSFSTATLAATFTVSFFVLGRISPELVDLAAMARNEQLADLMRAVYTVLPNLARLNPMDLLLHGIPPADHVVSLFLYAIGYAAMLLVGACWVFSRRDLK
jgi:ABC-type transport system involved in multi-copper enzyme maturation permease subunit